MLQLQRTGERERKMKEREREREEREREILVTHLFHNHDFFLSFPPVSMTKALGFVKSFEAENVLQIFPSMGPRGYRQAGISSLVSSVHR